MSGFNPFNIEAMTANKGIDFVSKDKQSMAGKKKLVGNNPFLPNDYRKTLMKQNGQKKIKK